MRPAIFLLVAVCVCLGHVPVRAAMTTDDLVFYGVESMGRGRFPQAVEAFSDVLTRDPDNPYARGRLALALAGNGQTDKARQTLEAALAARGDDLFALWTLGCLDLLADKPQAAAGRFAAMLAADPANARARVGLGLAALAGGRLADGVMQLDKARQEAPGDPLARHLAGLAYWMLDAPACARQELEISLEFEPQNADTLELLGLVYRRLGKNSLAKSAWEQALAVEQDRPRARFFLSRLAEDAGLAATLAGKPQEARRAYERALAIDASNMAAARGLGLPTLNAVGPSPAREAVVRPGPPEHAGTGKAAVGKAAVGKAVGDAPGKVVPPPGKTARPGPPAKTRRKPVPAPAAKKERAQNPARAPRQGKKTVQKPAQKPVATSPKPVAREPAMPGGAPSDAR